MEALNELGIVFAFSAGVGAFLGYLSGWVIVLRGGKTSYFQELAHRCAEAGMTKNQFACFVGIRLAVSVGAVASVLYGMAKVLLT